MSSFEKSVKGGTKPKLAPPKSKYVEHILLATQSGEAGVAEVFRTLTYRLRDSTWTIAFKALIIVHLMVKEGAKDVTLSYLSSGPETKLAINHFTEAQTQGGNIRRYAEYLCARSKAFGHAKCDYVRSGDTRLKRLPVDKGLLRETELVQEQVRALLRCDLLNADVENEITLTAFRLLTRDLLDLYNVENEAVMNVLSHYFEMSRPDAERAIRIYKKFCTETEEVVRYLGVARQYEHATRLQIPKLKHAPTGLAKSLQEYLDDKDFEINRRQYLAEQEAKRTGKPVQTRTLPKATDTAAQAKAIEAGVKPPPKATAQTTAIQAQPPKGPPPDLIDFFESIEQNQQTLGQNAPQFQPQVTGYPAQQQQQQQQQAYGFQQNQQYQNGFAANGTNPFGQPMPQQQPQPVQTQFTGAGFGGYGPQPQQQFVGGNAFDQQQQQQFAAGNAFAQPEQQMYTSPIQSQSPSSFAVPQQTGSTNPFRQSSLPVPAGGIPATFNPAVNANPGISRSGTNPFARSTGSPPTAGSPFAPQAQASFLPQQTQTPPPMQVQPTGTNPFARNQAASAPPHQNTAPAALQVQQTGTNPFRQSAFVNQQTGQGWQHAPQATMGGFESLETIPVFPRPA